MLLAIDTATRTLSLALHNREQICAELTWTTANQHTVELTPAIQELMARVKVQTTDLTLLAVSQGPGSFNGLRIGFSMAKGLAMALKIPLVTVPTLDVVAAAQPCFHGTLIAVAQAGRGRVCAQHYDWQADRWTARNDTRIAAWDQVLETIEEDTVISGEVDAEGRAAVNQKIADGMPVRLAEPGFALRRAGFLADLGWIRWLANGTDEAMTAAPIYLHQPGVPHP